MEVSEQTIATLPSADADMSTCSVLVSILAKTSSVVTTITGCHPPVFYVSAILVATARGGAHCLRALTLGMPWVKVPRFRFRISMRSARLIRRIEFPLQQAGFIL